MAGFPDGFVTELKLTANLETLARQFVPDLKKGSTGSKGCCPFHSEKSPSFNIYAKDNTYHCFGCGEHGDAVNFIMKVKNLSFPDAVRDIAATFGIKVPEESAEHARQSRRKADLKSAIAAASAIFQKNLWLPEAAPAREYLTTRRITDETIRLFGLGWCGSDRGGLVAELTKQGFSEVDLLEAGILGQKDPKQAPYLIFSNRIIIPIRARNGDTISFGGRQITGEGPKYINGAETPLFSKKLTVFGLDRISDGKTTPVVVEGYLDVITLAQAGISGAVAPLGTALTIDQMEAIWAIHPSPILCFDGDNAGRNAAAKSVQLALKGITTSRSFRVAMLPEGEDPDSFVREKGKALFDDVLKGSESFVSALYRTIKTKIYAEAVKAEQINAGPLPAGYTKGEFNFAQRGPLGRQQLRLALEAATSQIADPALAVEVHTAMLKTMASDRPEVDLGTVRTSAPGVMPQLPEPLANRSRLLLAMAIKWPDLLSWSEELIQVLPLPENLTSLRDEMLRWSSLSGPSRQNIRDYLNTQGADATAADLIAWADNSPIMNDDNGIEITKKAYMSLVKQGRSQFEAWARHVDSKKLAFSLGDQVKTLQLGSSLKSFGAAHSPASPKPSLQETAHSPSI